MNKADQKEDDDGQNDQPRPLLTAFPVIDNRARSTRLPTLDVSNGNIDEEGQEQPTSSNSKDSSSKSPSPPLHHADETIVPNSSDILLG